MLSPNAFVEIVAALNLAVFVFRDGCLIYHNATAQSLAKRLASTEHVEFSVLLRDSLKQVGQTEQSRFVTVVTSPSGQQYYVHLSPLPQGSRKSRDWFITVRQFGAEREAVQRRYGLSTREGQVLELLLRGYSNRDIARSLGIATTTTKKHLTRIFDKVGVDSRGQLISRLA